MADMLNSKELEDPPEALHTPWGVWLHRNDALHKIEQKYDAEHVIRSAMMADDILHYANYVPKIGKDEQKIKPPEISFEYDYSHEEINYDVKTELEKEDIKAVELTTNISLEESVNSDNKQEEAEHNEEEKYKFEEGLAAIIKNFGKNEHIVNCANFVI